MQDGGLFYDEDRRVETNRSAFLHHDSDDGNGNTDHVTADNLAHSLYHGVADFRTRS